MCSSDLGQRFLDAEPVGNGASEEANDGESAVDGSVGIGASLGVDLTTAAQAVDSVEHACDRSVSTCMHLSVAYYDWTRPYQDTRSTQMRP